MTDLRQAAQAVVDRWDTPAWEWREKGPTADLIAALRKALEQQQAEPVQEYITHITWDERGVRTVNGIPDDAPQRKPLTDAQIAALLENCIGSLPVAKQLIRAVEAAHGIKEGT